MACGVLAGLTDSLRASPVQITLETLLSLIVLVMGIIQSSQPLREITWAAEMGKR